MGKAISKIFSDLLLRRRKIRKRRMTKINKKRKRSL